MTFKMTYDIRVSNFKLTTIESVTIIRSVELLSDTAKITIPSNCLNKSISIKNKIKRGDSVEIKLGYDKTNVQEFIGYVDNITEDNGTLVINCEDDIYTLKKGVKNQVFTKSSVNEILKNVVSEINPTLTIVCDYEFTYDKFTVKDANAYDVVKKIQDETKANIYIKDGKLHIHPQYSEIFGHVKYNFSRNIDRDGIELKYKEKEDKKVQVIVEYTGADGKLKKYEYGDIGGDKISIKASTSDSSSLKKIAEEHYLSKSYTGYEGSFKSWLIPFCDAGYKVTITDNDTEYKNGDYYVVGVNVEFSQSGGVRTIKIGKKLS
jgi:hypothetical protein